MSDDGPTIAGALRETHVLAQADRAPALAWAETLGRDVARAVREATTARRLGALADVLDQRLAWPRFRGRHDDLVPERAAAIAELRARGPDHPINVRLRALGEQAKSPDPGVRAAAMRALREEHEDFMESDLGRAFDASAPESALDAHVEELRAALDLPRMIAALAARPVSETDAEREERVIRETLADERELLEAPDDPSFSGLWGGTGGRAFRVLSPDNRRRLIEEGKALRARLRGR